MTNKTHVGFLLISATVLSVVLAACGGDGPSTPTALTAPAPPPPTAPSPPPANITISGVVYGTAYRPLRGATVEVTEGTVGDWCEYGPRRLCASLRLSPMTRDGFGSQGRSGV